MNLIFNFSTTKVDRIKLYKTTCITNALFHFFITTLTVGANCQVVLLLFHPSPALKEN